MNRQAPEPGGQHRPAWQVWALGAAVIVLGVALWLALRPSRPIPWNDRAITADFQSLTIQKPVSPEEAGATPGDVHVVFAYKLTNATDHTYELPEPKHGVLMKSVTGGGWQDVDSVEWEQHLKIRARQSVEVEFDMAIPSTDPGAPEDLPHQKDLAAAGMERVRGIGGLEFFDYEHHYVIHLPKGWG